MNRLTLFLLLAFLPGACAAAGNYSQREDVRQFVSDMAGKHGFGRSELTALFGHARFQPAIIRAMTVQADPKQRSWQGYRALFVNAQRIEEGVRFSERNSATLERAAREFGLPAEIVVAIIGIETVYGRNMGNYRVIDALSTLAFDFPRRAEYFRDELEHFLLYARDAGVDVLAARGSYAGAIGIPQFMPGSYRRFALDYDGDGKRDLLGSAADAIGSVANFLNVHGWDTGSPAALPASVAGNAYRRLLDAGIKPQFRRADLESSGVSGAESLSPDTLCALIELETPGQASEYRIALNNFYVLTRYNRSSFYASAVLELARAITQARSQAAISSAPR